MDLNGFDKLQTVVARGLGPKTPGLIGVCSGYYQSKVVQSMTTSELVTGSWAHKAH